MGADFIDVGFGQCRLEGGTDRNDEYHHGVGSDRCRTICDETGDCVGYAVSSYGNCMVWHCTGCQVHADGNQWGNAHCMAKQLAPPVLRLDGVARLGSHIEVVAAYGRNELLDDVASTEISDNGEGNFHRECWNDGNCRDDGADICEWCGEHDGASMYCCRQDWSYSPGHACYEANFGSLVGQHHCVTPATHETSAPMPAPAPTPVPLPALRR